MIQRFMDTYPHLGYVAGAIFLGLSGYGLSRLYPRDPLLAIGSWLMALALLAFGVAGLGWLSPVGPPVALASVVGGLVWIARYYKRHQGL